MFSFFISNKEIILFSISVSGFILSLYNLFNDRRRMKLSYTLQPDSKSKRLIFIGIVSNPSKIPNSIVLYSFRLNGIRIDTSRYHAGGFDMGHFHQKSVLTPIEFGKSIPVGSTIAFQDVLKLKSFTPDDNLVLHVKTANYTKSFKLKMKEHF
ncbi:hypothetical protein [Enterococcus raffinosus]|nr:hypothetical protein [Enterococcus raffinosus]MDT2530355.1 hypothetical protein [Enterococcus raffinosus]MDT2580041.1 hypothetical protein [Enterococcus raffinosus]MDT2589419.1 hypothetical protein [Enterococcus raffinosus]